MKDDGSIKSELDAAARIRYLDVEHGKATLRTERVRPCLLIAKTIMYVSIGAASLIYANGANARDLLWKPNQAGGETILTDMPAKACPPGARAAADRNGDGTLRFGCWSYTESGYVFLRWSKGDIRMFRLTDFQMFDTPASTDKPL